MSARRSREEIAAESPVAKAYWAQWNSLKLVSGCLHRVWESEDGQSSRNVMIVSKVRIPKVVNELHYGPREEHMGITRTLEKLKEN